MRIWNGLIPHSIVLYKGRMYKINALYEKDGGKFADIEDSTKNVLTQIDIMELEKVDD